MFLGPGQKNSYGKWKVGRISRSLELSTPVGKIRIRPSHTLDSSMYLAGPSLHLVPNPTDWQVPIGSEFSK